MTDFETELHALGDGAARDAYAALAAVSEQATVFASLAFAEATCEAFGLRGRIALVRDESDVPAAGAILFEKRRGPFRAAALPPYAEYLSPLLREPLQEADVHRHASPLDALLARLDEAFDQLTFQLHPSLTDMRAFQWAGWKVTPAYRYRARLGDEAADGWSRRPRRTFRHHRDTFTLLDGPDHLDALLRLEAEIADRKGLNSVKRTALRRLVLGLVEVGTAHVLTAQNESDGQIEAGVVMPFDSGTGYYWMVGSRPGPAVTVLLGHLEERLRAQGCTHCCLGGANVPSVAEFKRRLGGELVPYFRARRVTHPALRLADRLLDRT